MFILIAGMLISALPFAFHHAIFSKEMHTTKMRPEIYAYFGIIAISIIAFYSRIVSTTGLQSMSILPHFTLLVLPLTLDFSLLICRC